MSASLLDARVTVKSSFNPAAISQGESAAYIITVSGSRDQIQGGIASVPGLELQYAGAQQFVNIGRKESGVNYQFRVRTAGPGVYTVPAYQITLGLQTYTVPKATLKVVRPEDRYAQGEGKAFWFEHETLDGQYYTGQSIPLTLKFYLREGIRITGITHPEKQGDAFSMIPFTDQQPTEHATMVEGARYRVYHWDTAITPLKNGLQDLQFTIEGEVLVLDQSSRRRSLFDSPLDDIFGRRGKRLAINPATTAHQLDIRSLPDEDKPDSFTGAIGVFSMDEIELSDKLANAGEPITLTVSIRGTGNFDRIQAPALTQTEGWQTYDPEAAFIVDDTLGLSGTKKFAYTIIPISKEVTRSPGLSFSYFDPRTGQYIAYDSQPQTVEVIPAKSGSPIIIQHAANSNPAAGNERAPQPKQLELLPIQLVAGGWSQGISPPLLSPLFWAAQTIPLCTIFGIALFRNRQLRLRHDDRFARKIKASKGVQTWLAKAKQASQANDANTFYAAATRTLQEFIGGITHQEPESLTLAEIEDHLIGCQADPEQLVHINEFFEANDTLKFSGGTTTLPNAPELFEKLEALIRGLQKVISSQ